MDDLLNVYDVLENKFQEQCMIYRDITYQKYKGSKDKLPLAMLHRTGVYLFFDKKQKQRDILNESYELMRFVQKNIDCKTSMIMCFAISELKLASNKPGQLEDALLNKISIEAYEIDIAINRVKFIDDLVAEVAALFQTRPVLLNDDEITSAGLKISTSLQKTNQIIKKVDGTQYIFKKQKWYKLSELDGDSYFYEYMLGGVFGLPYFKHGYTTRGVIHLITLNGLGFGWLIDCLCLIIGVGKDPDGYYIEPLKNKGVKLILLVIMAAIVFIVIFMLLQLLFVGAEQIMKIVSDILIQGGQ